MRVGTTVIARVVASFICLLLCASFLVHVVQVEHAHYGTHAHTHGEPEGYETLGEFTHATEKKMFLYFVLAYVTFNLTLSFFCTAAISFNMHWSYVRLTSVSMRQYLLRYVHFLLFPLWIVEPRYH